MLVGSVTGPGLLRQTVYVVLFHADSPCNVVENALAHMQVYLAALKLQ